MLYRAPFPNVTADTAIFRIAASKPTPEQRARIGEFGGNVGTIEFQKITSDPRVRFQYVGEDDASKIIDRIRRSNHIADLSHVVATTSGVGGKSQFITRERINANQMEILKGESKNTKCWSVFFQRMKTCFICLYLLTLLIGAAIAVAAILTAHSPGSRRAM